MVIIENHVLITGIHYTSWENATQIKSMERMEPSLDDPFVYLSQPGVMQNWSEDQIRKELGALSANTEIKLTVIVPIEKVWLKVGKNAVHFAISGIVTKNQIQKLSIQRRKQAS